MVEGSFGRPRYQERRKDMTRQQGLGKVCGTFAAALGLAALMIGTSAMAAELDHGKSDRVSVIADKPAVSDSESPSALAREGMAKMLQAITKLAESVPQFEMPQVNENGDIILRRKRPETAPQSPPTRVPDPSEGSPI
jgi:hypothetical protein